MCKRTSAIVVYMFCLTWPRIGALADDVDSWRLTITPDVSDIVVSEPLYLTMRLQNQSDQRRKLYGVPLQNWELFVAYDGAGFVKVPGLSEHGDSFVLEEIDPKGEIARTILFSFARSDGGYRPIFERSGEYKLRIEAILDGSRGLKIQSNIATVHAARGDDADGRAQLLYTHPTMAEWLRWQSTFDDNFVQDLNKIIEIAPTSIFADHAHLRLAELFDTRNSRSENHMQWTRGQDDNLWRIPYVQKWVVGRILHHYGSVSVKNRRLKARAIYAAAATILDNRHDLPDDFDLGAFAREMDAYAELADELTTKTFHPSKLRQKIQFWYAEQEPVK